MSAFGIYFLVLTSALIIYYAVIIVMDLLKKGKKGKSDEEEIEVDNEDEQKSVVETAEGFDVSSGALSVDEEYPDEGGGISDDEDEFISEEELPVDVDEKDYEDDQSPSGDGGGEGLSGENADDTLADIQQQMDESLEDADPQYQEVMDSISFEVMLEQPRSMSSSSKILKTFEED